MGYVYLHLVDVYVVKYTIPVDPMGRRFITSWVNFGDLVCLRCLIFSTMGFITMKSQFKAKIVMRILLPANPSARFFLKDLIPSEIIVCFQCRKGAGGFLCVETLQ